MPSLPMAEELLEFYTQSSSVLTGSLGLDCAVSFSPKALTPVSRKGKDEEPDLLVKDDLVLSDPAPRGAGHFH